MHVAHKGEVKKEHKILIRRPEGKTQLGAVLLLKSPIKYTFNSLFLFHIRTVHLDIIRVLFSHQLMHQ